MKVNCISTNYFEENCYLLYNDNSDKAVVIDPGMMKDKEMVIFDQALSKINCTGISHILITHCHIDHVAAADKLARRYNAPVLMGADDSYLIDLLPEQVARFRLRIDVPELSVDTFLKDGDKLTLLGEPIEVIATPGHSRGSLCFYLPQSAIIFTGDTLFMSSFGRTDLPGGSLDSIIDSIKRLLTTLPGDTLVASGHGDTTTIDNERRFNPIAQQLL